jgi:ferrochelatase
VNDRDQLSSPEPTSGLPVSAPRAESVVASPSSELDPYDAVILVSFGGPEAPDEVLPFLENVTRGRGIPRERLAEVGEHYFLFGGRSPINDQCRTLLAALGSEFSRRSLDVPLYWGNRNSEPFLAAEMARIVADGHRRVLAVMTSAYPSYSSCRQYRENLYDAASGTGLQVDRLRHYAHHPGFVAASVEATLAALTELGEHADGARLVFVTHSIPTSMAVASGPPPKSDEGGYVDWHRAVAAEVTRQVSQRRGVSYEHDLAYCSRSGPPSQPWLEPDINDHLAELDAAGVPAVVAVPIGFVSDHMEVIYDLDTEAAATARELGLPFARAATAGVHPDFVSGLVDLMVERAEVARGQEVEAAVIAGGTVGRYECLPGCCVNARNPDRPTLCQSAAVAV